MAMFDTGCSPRRCLRGHRFLRQPIPAGRLREQGGRWEGLRFLEQGVRTGRDQPYCFMMVSRIRFILGLKGMTGWALTPRCWGELTSCFGDDVRAAAIDMIRPCVNSASYCTALASIHTSTIKGNLFRGLFFRDCHLHHVRTSWIIQVQILSAINSLNTEVRLSFFQICSGWKGCQGKLEELGQATGSGTCRGRTTWWSRWHQDSYYWTCVILKNILSDDLMSPTLCLLDLHSVV